MVGVEEKTQEIGALAYRKWLEAMEDPVRVVYPDGRVVYENEALRRLSRRFSKETSAPFPIELSRPVFDEGVTDQTDFCLDRTVFSVTSSPVKEGSETVAAIQVFRDITRRDHLTQALYGDNQRMQEEMRFARSIQEEMLPVLTAFGPLRFSYRYLPSHELSGDFFDLVPLGRGRLALYISDVVGHGVSASILTMFVRQSMRAILKEEKIAQPTNVLASLMRRFKEISGSDSQYFTLFYAVFDMQNRQVTYANAGHNCPPLLKRQGSVQALEARGMIISPLFSHHVYEQHQIDFYPQDRFLFYTDGATEARNRQGEAFGQAHLEGLLRDQNEHLLDGIAEEIGRFSQGKVRDDIALLQVDCLHW